MRKFTDLRLLAPGPVCGSKMGVACVEINVAQTRGPAGGGSLTKFRKALARRERPHESREHRSVIVEMATKSIGQLARSFA